VGYSSLCGEFLSSNSRVSVVTKDPMGCMTDLVGACCGAWVAGASVCKSNVLAPVSSKSVVFKFDGLTQPGVVCKELTK
jgi:hypothetical protein